MMAKSHSHNRLTHEFIRTVVREVIDDGDSDALMVVLESIITGVMVANVHVFGLKPEVSAGLAEACLQRAMERFAGAINGKVR